MDNSINIGAPRAASLLLAAAIMFGAHGAHLSAQGTKRVALSATLQAGAAFNGMLALPAVDFVEFPGVASCIGQQNPSRFSSGTGGGVFIAAMLSLRPAVGIGLASHLGGSLKLGLQTNSTTFEGTERLGQAVDANNQPTDVVTRYLLNVKMPELRIEPSASYWLSDRVPIIASVGLRLGYTLSGTFNHTEKIDAPAGAVFTSGSDTRDVSSGDLGEFRRLQLGIGLGVAYEIELGPTMVVRPEVSGLLGLGSPVKEVKWNASELRFGVALLYNLPKGEASPLEEN